MSFFELRSARDIFLKTERELHKLQLELTIDNIFNFFVTAYHIQDYVRHEGTVHQIALESFLSDADLKDCHDLCDKGKHLRLTRRADPKTQMYSGALNGAPFNEVSFNGGDKWVLLTEQREVDVEWLAHRVTAKWREFLTNNSLL